MAIGSEQVVAALRAAVAGVGGLVVVAQLDLRGAMVAGPRSDVYLVPTSTGVSVECWHSGGRDPYRVVSVAGLDEAVQIALAEL